MLNGRGPSYWVVAFSGWLSKGVIVASQLMIIRLLTSSLGVEVYSAVALVLGVNAWCGLLDAGLGTTLQNKVSECRARQDLPWDHILTTTFLAVLFMACVAIVIWLISPVVGGAFLRNVTSLSQKEKGRVFLVGCGALVVSSISTIALKVWYAQRKGYIANILSAVGALLTLLSVGVVSGLDVQGRVVWSMAACTFPNATVGLLALAWHLAESKLKGGVLRGRIVRDVLRGGANVSAFGLLSVCVLQLDYIILSQVAAPRDVVLYAITTKLILVAGVVHTAVLQAVWPEFSELYVTRDRAQFARRIRSAIAIGTGVVGVWSCFCIAFKDLLLGLVAPRLDVGIPAMLIGLLGAYYMIRAWTDTFSTAIASTGNLTPLWRWVPIQAVASVILMLALAPSLGVWGVVMATVVSFLGTVVWALPLEVRRMMSAPSVAGMQ